MTTTTIAAMFDTYSDAAGAVRRLRDAGISENDISIVSNDTAERGRYDDTTGSVDHPDAKSGAGTGAAVGTAVGAGAGLLTGLGIMAIPGIGPVVAAGWLATTLLGAGVGAATGTAVGALTGLGVDEAHAHGYAEGIKRGGTLVTVRADDSRAAAVTDILDDEGTIDMAERESTWRKEGWSGTYAGTDATAGTAGVVTPTGTSGSVAGAPGEIGRRRVGSYPSSV